MKRTTFIFSFLIFIFLSANAFAKCMVGDVSASPNPDVMLPANANVIVTLFGNEREKFEAKRGTKYFFKSDINKVEAKLIKEWDSEANLRALHFKAAENLKVGRIYTLEVNFRSFAWEIVGADVAKPQWDLDPKQISFEKIKFGCGPAVNFILTLNVVDASPVFYEVVMKTEDGKQQYFVVETSDGKVKIGHGMCSGGFVPPQGKDAQVDITPYDFAGNKGETRTITLSSK